MKPSKHVGRAFVFNAFLFSILAWMGRAYLEPGAGSFLLKILISSLVGFILVFRRIWSTIRFLFSKKDSKKQEKEPAD
jgi:hypothetical protein